MRHFMLTTFSLLAVFFAGTAMAQGAKTLDVGDTIPGNFVGLDASAKSQTYADLAGDKGLVLLFVRSADWCKYCKAQLKDWNENVKAVEAAGFKLVAMSYDDPAILREFTQQNDIGYTLLSDTHSQMISAFGIRNTNFNEGSRFYGIPNPAIYVFDPQGKIIHVAREGGYKVRPRVKDVVAFLQNPGAAK